MRCVTSRAAGAAHRFSQQRLFARECVVSKGRAG